WEAGRRARWSEPQTTATLDGETWRLDGTKVHVPDAIDASLVLVIAQSPEGRCGVFLVEPNAAGVTITETPTVDGTRKEGTVTMVGAEARPIGDDDTIDAIAATVDRLGVAMVVDGVGAASRALELAV
ncbi:acyl-CoA dehydrogenase family protein, partial [Bradyrhizobium sp. NBAIM08]|uniref:acyl-CoA dehydrogenase family protein n=1 Tax=Bradyrhizobium sp. NBAIM08 TaxID=2793815 RepID=UPI001CD5E9DF